ncbi:hypothetical protein ACPWL5_005134, partial [Escherichia coli]
MSSPEYYNQPLSDHDRSYAPPMTRARKTRQYEFARILRFILCGTSMSERAKVRPTWTGLFFTDW